MGTGPCPMRSPFADRQMAREAVSASGLRGRVLKGRERERRWKRRREGGYEEGWEGGKLGWKTSRRGKKKGEKGMSRGREPYPNILGPRPHMTSEAGMI